jgi:hypothetical protein
MRGRRERQQAMFVAFNVEERVRVEYEIGPGSPRRRAE